MNTPSPITPPPRSSGTAPTGNVAPPQPTSARENSGLMYFFIGAAVLALLIVLGFNALGPEGASRTGVGDGPAQSHSGPTTGGPSPDADARAGAGAAGPATAGQAAGAGTTVVAPTPQVGDTPTPPGRESVGAPAGGAPQAGQAVPEGISGRGAATPSDAPATGAQSSAASATPAAPPASR